MQWWPAIELLGFLSAGFLSVAVFQAWEARRWRADLMALRLRLPSDIDLDDVSRMLSILAGSTRNRPITFEIIATARGIRHFVLVPSVLAPRVVTTLTTTLPSIRIEDDPEYLSSRPAIRLARELRCSRSWRPLAADRGASAIAGYLSVLYPLHPAEVVRIQWIFRNTRHTRLKGEPPAELVRDFREKQSTPLLQACGRVAVSAPHKRRAGLLMSGVMAGLGVLNSPGVALVPRILPSAYVAGKVYPRAFTLVGPWPCLLNAAEAAAVVGMPPQGITVPGLATGSAAQLPVPPDMPNTGLIVAESNYPGMEGRPLTLAPDDRLRHVSLQAPTGAGKSELMANMFLQDINAGYGGVVLDPKSDLVADILARIPEKRLDDVILMDPSALETPVGFNLLQSARDELSRELVVDRTVHIFSQLWRTSWGPRTADVMRNSLLSLISSRGADGSPLTLVELPELLLNPDFRRMVLKNGTVSPAVLQFWSVYDRMSEAEQLQVIGPTLNKIRAFTVRAPLRLMLGQSTGVDLGSVFRDGKILLVPLSKGSIGPEAAQLLGSLVLACLWQECLHRTTVPKHKRKPVFAYLDEFPDVLRFAAARELADILAQARGLGWGLTLAFQYLNQLTPEVASAILGTVRTQIVFQLEYADAHTMARRFAPLEREDLANLDAWEIAMRPCIDGSTRAPVTGSTFMMPGALHDPEMVRLYSLTRYGNDRLAVDQARARRIKTALQINPAANSWESQEEEE
ncbi:type IV secretory system conjugative DNA transfer family protein [Actinomadura spongiicola]|uniref:Type IV secretory system conjugative DNA transfer family protein n=1 Tax=Actinomadura spongiicola TaxID=2303421 RepID=A0A372G8P8_9ACTN|nr:type IV secretory system conjugative DNA transfer family protein [Actinomadura spongiicola]RFS81766.1 type IV secretory system conjugative DNA transfer family protein [Actinomadura spongiicola]